jgi:hypothetical protein
MVAGDGGIGKSRLCLELAKKMEEQGWSICYPRDRSRDGLRSCSDTLVGDTLFILDYAEADATAIRGWLSALRRTAYDTIRIRVILILRKRFDTFLLEPKIRVNRYQEKPLSTAELKAGTFKNPGPLRRILKDFVEKNGDGLEVDEQLEEAILNNLVEIDKETQNRTSKNRPLFLQIVAGAFIAEPKNLRSRPLREVLNLTIEKEMDLIKGHIKDSCPPSKSIFEFYEIGMRIVACATFVNGITVKKADGPSDFETLLPTDRFNLTAVWPEFSKNRYLFDVSEDESICPPMEPDIIGEYFVLKCLRDMANDSPKAVARLLDAIWGNRCKEAIAFVQRVRRDHPGDYAELFEWQQDKKWDAAIQAGMNKMGGIDETARTLTFANMPWRFLDFKPAAGDDPARVLLLSENIIGLHAYDEQGVFDDDDKEGLFGKLFDQINPTNWEKCSLQKLLNLKDGAFWQNRIALTDWERIAKTYNCTLSKDEVKAVVETEDWMFLLDTDQAERYFVDDGGRKAWLALNPDDINETASRIWEKNLPGRTRERMTKMVKSWDINSVNESEESKPEAHWWWLRSPSFDARAAADVDTGGSVGRGGSYVVSVYVGVRPAFWLNLKS